VVSGSRSASTTWQVSSRLHLNTRDWIFSLPKGALTRHGRVGGLVIRRGADVLFALVDDAEIGEPLLFGVQDPVLLPGNYTVTLVADAATSVTIPFEGSSRISRLRPRHAARVTRSSMSTLENPNVPVVHGSMPLTVAGNSVLLLASAVQSTAQQAAHDDLCLSIRQEPCPLASIDGSAPAGAGSESVGPGNTGSGRGISALFFYPGHVKPGQYYAQVDQATVGLVVDARLVAIGIAP